MRSNEEKLQALFQVAKDNIEGELTDGVVLLRTSRGNEKPLYQALFLKECTAANTYQLLRVGMDEFQDALMREPTNFMKSVEH